MFADLMRKKSLDEILAAPEAGHDRGLKRNLSAFSLTMLGIGAVIGAGIFSSVGTAAAGGADHLGAGPALMLSFVLTAVACGFAALCYAELASMVPISGSAYTYSYATLGELVAWIIGWDLIIEYAVGNIAVAISWSGYFQELLRGFGIALAGLAGHRLPHGGAGRAPASPRRSPPAGPADRRSAPPPCARPTRSPARRAVRPFAVVFNLPAFLIVMLHHRRSWCAASARAPAFNSWMVVLKLAIIGFFIGIGAFYVKPENWTPFAPNGFERHRRRGGDHLLRLHRLRRRLDRRRGEQQPAARHADRDPRQPRRSAR